MGGPVQWLMWECVALTAAGAGGSLWQVRVQQGGLEFQAPIMRNAGPKARQNLKPSVAPNNQPNWAPPG